MNLLNIIFENPPKDDEKQTQYFERLSKHLNKSPSATSAAVIYHKTNGLEKVIYYNLRT